MEQSYLIDLKQVVKRFPMGKGSFTALKGLDLQFEAGEFAGLIGPSGSGKTTLLNIIGTLDLPSEGGGMVLGHPIEHLKASEAALLRKERIGFIFQSYNLLQVHTVFENVEFPLLLLGMPSEERRKKVMEALDWVGLADRHRSRPSQLSGGECQRVAIARAMVKQPSLVLADEPTANLDAANSHHVLKTMQQLNEAFQTTFLFATHDEKVISYLKRKIYLMDGQLVKDERV